MGETLDSRVATVFNLNDLSPATDLNHAINSFNERSKVVIDYFSEQPTGLFPLNKEGALDFAARAVASIRRDKFVKSLDGVLKNGRP